jgi:hypothetical protein
MPGWLARFFALSLIVFSSAVAIAAPKIVVFVPPNPSSFIKEATVRLRAELLVVGFELESGESEKEAIDPNELFARKQGATAAIRITRSSEGGAIDLWITDEVTHKIVARRVVEATPAALALRCVELLRASLLEIEMQAIPAPPEVKRFVAPVQKKPPAPPVEERHLMFEASTGVSIVRADPITSIQIAPVIEAGVAWDALRVGLRFIGPSTNGEYLTSSGTVTMRHHVLVVDAAYTFDVRHIVRVGPALAFGGYGLFVRGIPRPGFTGSQSTSVAFLGGAGLDVALVVSKAIEVIIDTRLYGALPSLVVAAGDRTTIGAPLWTGNLGLRVRL